MSRALPTPTLSKRRATARMLGLGLAVLLLASLAGRPALATNGAMPTSSGVRSLGRGGADTAVADDATAVNSNPAGLAFIDGQRFDSVLAAFVPDLRWRNAVDDVKSKTPSPGFVAGGAFAVAFDLEEPWKLGEALTFSEETTSDAPPRSSPEYKGGGWKFGLGVFPVSGSVVDFDARSPFFANDRQEWSADIKEIAVAVSVAWRPVRWLAIGISPEFVYAQLENNQPVTQPKTILAGHPTGTTGPTYAELAPFVGVNDIEGTADITKARTFGGRAVLGLLAIPVEWEAGRLQVGLSYTSQAFKQDFLGEATVDFTEQLRQLDPDRSLLGPAIESETGIPIAEQSYAGKYNVRLNPLNMPQQVSFGVSLAHVFESGLGILVAADVRWLEWSRTWKSLDGRLTDGESVELNELTGDASGSLALDVPLDWNDQLVFAGGIAVSPLDWLVVRAGYNYGKNPVPSNTVQPTTPAILEHHAMIGVGVHVRRFEFSLAWEHAFENTVKVGQSVSNVDVSQSEISASLDVIALGVSIRF